MKVTFNVDVAEDLHALMCALFVTTKQWEDEWKYFRHSSDMRGNRKCLQYIRHMYNQLLKYNNTTLTEEDGGSFTLEMYVPKIAGVSKKKYKLEVK